MHVKKSSYDFVFFTCPCKENEIIICSKIDSFLKKLLPLWKRITRHNRGWQTIIIIIIVLLKHIYHYKYKKEKESELCINLFGIVKNLML